MKKTSIILTCYKQEKFIEETILSVINQKYKNRELLIGDDSPTDECWDIITKYVNKYPDKIIARHHKPNKGIVNNMEFLMSKIDPQSDFVAFLEGDDCLYEDYLEKKIDIFKKYPSVQLIYNELSIINEKSTKIIDKQLKHHGCKYFYQDESIDLNEYFSDCSHPVYTSRSSFMVRKSITEKYTIKAPFLSDRNLISDYIFFWSIAANEHVRGVKEPLIYYRMHGNNTSSTSALKMIFELLQYVNYLKSVNLITETTRDKALCYYYLYLSLWCFKKAFSLNFCRAFSFGIKNIYKIFIR